MLRPRVMACVTGQLSCERYIRAGARWRDELGGELSVIHVAGAGRAFMGSAREGEALEALFQASKAHGADMTVLRARDVVACLEGHARAAGVTHIVIGGARGERDIARELRERLPGVEFDVLRGEEEPKAQPAP